MNDASKQPKRTEAAAAVRGPAALDEEQRKIREQAQLVEKLALRVLDECRVSLMLSFRYLDIALWKLPFVAREQKAALATDGTSLFFNPDLVILRFRASPNELIRDYLQVILHCVLRHPFETSRREPETWSIACDLCVEAIAMEMAERLYPCADDEARGDGLRVLRHNVDVLTPARVYRGLVEAARTPLLDEAGSGVGERPKRVSGARPSDPARKGPAWELEESVSFLEAIERMRPLFWRDDHEPWNLLKLSDEPDDASGRGGQQGGSQGDSDGMGEGDSEGQRQAGADGEQEADADEGRQSENAEGADDAEGGSGDAGSEGAGGDGAEGDGDADGEGDAGDSADGGGVEGDAAEGDGAGGDGADGDGADGDSAKGDASADGEGDAIDDSLRDEGVDAIAKAAQSSANAASQSPAASNASAPAAAAAAAPDSEDAPEGREAQTGVFAPVPGSADQADIYGYIEKDLREIIDMARLSDIEWTDISKRIEADLKTMSSMRGYEAGAFMANLALVNRSRIDYAEFLRRFSTAQEDAHMSDDEFDYIYYLYGLNRYGNMPLVEPLESRETFRIRDFVIALDTSGSTTGELERLFVTRTLELLKQSAHRGEEVNIHIVQCDSKIRKVTVITDIDQLDAFDETFEVYGMGGTDFRPVFTYVDDLLQQGHFGNLRGLLYFTDGMGVFPATPPFYDTAFVFVENEGKEMRVPPWAMRVVLDEDMIREW